MTYPDDLPAKVLALVEGEGYSARAAGRAVGVPEDIAVEWVKKSREATQGNKPIMDRWHRRVSKSLDLMERGLEVIEEDESNQLAYKSLQTLNIIAGTGTDKLQKDQDQALKNRSNEAAHSLADAIARLAALDTSRLADLIEARPVEAETRLLPAAQE